MQNHEQLVQPLTQEPPKKNTKNRPPFLSVISVPTVFLARLLNRDAGVNAIDVQNQLNKSLLDNPNAVVQEMASQPDAFDGELRIAQEPTPTPATEVAIAQGEIVIPESFNLAEALSFSKEVADYDLSLTQEVKFGNWGKLLIYGYESENESEIEVYFNNTYVDAVSEKRTGFSQNEEESARFEEVFLDQLSRLYFDLIKQNKLDQQGRPYSAFFTQNATLEAIKAQIVLSTQLPKIEWQRMWIDPSRVTILHLPFSFASIDNTKKGSNMVMENYSPFGGKNMPNNILMVDLGSFKSPVIGIYSPADNNGVSILTAFGVTHFREMLITGDLNENLSKPRETSPKWLSQFPSRFDELTVSEIANTTLDIIGYSK